VLISRPSGPNERRSDFGNAGQFAVKDNEQLIDQFKERLPNWTREDIAKGKLMRFAEAYLMRAGIKYRPAAPGDGIGGHLVVT
jgi:hypothetical protein